MKPIDEVRNYHNSRWKMNLNFKIWRERLVRSFGTKQAIQSEVEVMSCKSGAHWKEDTLDKVSLVRCTFIGMMQWT